MPISVNALREQRSALAKDTRNLLDNHPGKLWTAIQQAIYDEKTEEIGRVDGEIGRMQKQADIDADTALDTVIADANKAARRFEATSPRGIYDTFLRRGVEGFTAEQQLVIKNTMSTTTPSQGGYTVPSLIASQLYDAMKAYGAMRAVAEIVKTTDGKPLSYPTSDGTAETGEWIDQNVTATALDPSFGTASLNVFKASSKIVAVPFELLQDSTLDMESFVQNRLAQRIGRLGNTGFTVGTGTTQPDGIVPKASSGKVGTTGQTLTIIYDDVVDLIHSVDPAYRSYDAAFMTNDSLLKVLRKIKDTAGRPIWTPSYDGGVRSGLNVSRTPNTGDQATGAGNGDGGYMAQNQAVIFDYLLGYPVWVNNDIAVPAANAKTMLFGDFDYYKIRDAMEVQMFRFTDSVYTKLGQVGFLAWCRMGGNLIDTNAVKYYQHSAT
ncbi:MAG TPA: phage major capsid protein [Bradyrhizobium sp.]|jgi:HK97 family phage major capsid protein